MSGQPDPGRVTFPLSGVPWRLTLCTVLALLVLAGLGVWQVKRLAWKLDLIEKVETRLVAFPVPLWPKTQWASLEDIAFRRVVLTGTFDHARALHWFAHNRRYGVGYHLVTPLKLSGDGASGENREEATYVLVDRGFIPQAHKPLPRSPGRQPEGPVLVTGVARQSVKAGWLDAEDDTAGNIWFTRDVEKMGAVLGLEVAPFLVVAQEETFREPQADVPQPWPQRVDVRPVLKNNHLYYALTWFGLAVVLIGVYASYGYQHRRNGSGSSGPENG